MKNKYFFKLIISFFVYQLFIISEIQTKFEAVSVRLPNGQKKGALRTGINRAGVLLVVPLDNDAKNPFEKYGIIMGHDKNVDSWMVGQAGKCDHDDVGTAITASRELEEETGGYFKVSSEKIEKMPYLCAGEKQMYVYKIEDASLASKIKSAVRAIQFNKNISKCYKEIDDVEVVSLQEMFRLAKTIDACEIQQGKYFATTTTGKKIKLNTLYTQVFAHPCDHSRLEYSQKLFEMLF